MPSPSASRLFCTEDGPPRGRISTRTWVAQVLCSGAGPPPARGSWCLPCLGRVCREVAGAAPARPKRGRSPAPPLPTAPATCLRPSPVPALVLEGACGEVFGIWNNKSRNFLSAISSPWGFGGKLAWCGRGGTARPIDASGGLQAGMCQVPGGGCWPSLGVLWLQGGFHNDGEGIL